MADPVEVDSPFEADWTPNGLIAAGLVPIVIGDDWSIRIHFLDDDGSYDFTGALALLDVKKKETDTVALFSRRSDDVIGETATLQIEFDSQVTDNGATGSEGRGWLTIRIGSADAEDLLTTIGNQDRVFDLRFVFANGDVETRLRGIINFLRPRTDID